MKAITSVIYKQDPPKSPPPPPPALSQNTKTYPTPPRRRTLSEDWIDYSTPPLGDLLSPFSNLVSGLGNLFPLFPIRRQSPGFSSYLYITQPLLDTLRWYGRISFELNEYGQAGLTQLANYVCGPGLSYEAVPCQHEHASESLLKQVNKFLYKFREKNLWDDDQWERHCYIATRRDGDLFLRFSYSDQTGIPSITQYLGEEVRDEKYFTPEWSFGILTDNKSLTIPKSWQVWSRTSDIQKTEILQDYAMIRFQNHLSTSEAKRGLTDFFSISDLLTETKKLLQAGRVGETARQAIAYIQEFSESNAGEVQTLENNSAGLSGGGLLQLSGNVFGNGQGVPNTMPVTQITPGTVESLPQGMAYKDGPKGDAEPVETLVKASLRACAARWNIPINLLDGEVDAAFAAALVEEGPLTKRVQVDQQTAKRRYASVMKRAILYGVRWELLPANTLDLVDIQVEAPPIIPRDPEGETDRNEVLVRNRVMSRSTWAKRENLDFESEQELLAAEDEEGITQAVVGEPTDGEEGDSKSQTAGATYQRETGRNKL